jgi:hypothetical protein
MKAWRKHNSTKFVRANSTRKQARTHFQSEVAGVSTLVYNLLIRVGIVKAA